MVASTSSTPPARRLLDWYDQQRRDLPWRTNPSPYKTWISEIMLQQTQVRTVIPYFLKFLDTYPTVEALAAAPLDEVLAAWSGLGYYRRARQLHQAAAAIVERGGFPTTATTLRELPGIGEYTAAAIASIAFGEVVPVLDGNVERCVSRWLAQAEDPKRSAPRRRLRQKAHTLLDPQRPGDSNQALMELGATVCRPTQPNCDGCPLNAGCLAYAEGTPERYPPPKVRRKTERRKITVAVVESNAGRLFFQRPADAEVMPDLWELPQAPTHDTTQAIETALAEGYGGTWQLGPVVATLRHSITFRSFEVTVRRAHHRPGPTARSKAWVEADQRSRYATSSLVDKVLTKLAQGTAPGPSGKV